METESRINPWVRANLQQYDIETLALLPDDKRQAYGQVMHELLHSAVQLQYALERYAGARAAQAEFFGGMGNGTI